MTLAVCRDSVRKLVDDDYILDADLDTLIRRAELKMERDLVKDGEYRPQQMRTSVTLTSTVQGIALPDDYQRMRTVWMHLNPMRYVSPDKMPPGSTPEDAEVTLYYYKRIPALTETQSNWLFDLAEDLYMYGSALQWVPYQRDTTNMQLWERYYGDALNTLREATKSQPTGSWISQKGRPFRGRYTIEDGYVRLNGQDT